MLYSQAVAVAPAPSMCTLMLPAAAPGNTGLLCSFNLRDLCKVLQGMLMATPGGCASREALQRLWLHEECRVFHDRLVSQEDRDYLKAMLVSGHG